MNKKAFSALTAACCIAGSMAALISTPAAAQTGRPATSAAMSEQQFAKCAATYDFLIKTVTIAYRNGSLSRSQYDQMSTSLVANRGLIGNKYFSQKGARPASALNAMIKREADLISKRMLSGQATVVDISNESDRYCYYKFIRP